MSHADHDWIVFHRVRFAEPVDGLGNPFPGPKSAAAWRFYPASQLSEDNMRNFNNDEWGGFGIYPNREAAQAVFDVPEAHLSFLADPVEAYHALIAPYAHHGEVNWRGETLANDTFAVAKEDPGGPLVVFTSAGFEGRGPEDAERIVAFLHGVYAVQDYYAGLPGNIRQAVYSGVGVDGGDGITVSLWQNDAAMMQAAYKPGEHRGQMDNHKKTSRMDRSSFTRARIIASKGSWKGCNPVSEIERVAV
ncbi:hypothetical protein [Hoeflea prorocentri]|uniref:Uncharacterized protein n=1 Tax=Hoeflea prorocentri TaxID=1922333 RepID=A0A9X3UM04_9HYPH|nr:hypothetical protein [Hoeflea prorocentri]MCY6382865.1 hypothetical protein [Hoeflea prorocentri]MDA5400665.1 hypothetical protein [Hoeflea prorocentri]